MARCGPVAPTLTLTLTLTGQVDLLLAEAQLMRETGGKSKVEWTLWP